MNIKRVKMLIAMLMLVICGVGGCKEKDKGEETTTKVTQQKQKKEYVYKVGDGRVAMGTPVEDALALLGTDYEYFEAPSCAVEGLDYYYYYQNVTMVANDINGQRLVTGLWLLNDAVSTAEGIHIQSTNKEVLAAYGNDYEMRGTQMLYSGKNTILTIGIKDGKVNTIEYAYSSE